MNIIAQETTNTIPTIARSAKRKLGSLSMTTVTLACICIYYSSSSHAQVSFTYSVINGKTDVDLIKPAEGANFEINPGETLSLDVNVKGSWDFTYANNTGTTKQVPLEARFQVFDTDSNERVVDRLLPIDTYSVRSRDTDTPANPHTVTGATFDTTVSLTPSLGEGHYRVTVFANTDPSGIQDSNISVTQIPEPETYAMMLAGLGLLGWRLRHSRS